MIRALIPCARIFPRMSCPPGASGKEGCAIFAFGDRISGTGTQCGNSSPSRASERRGRRELTAETRRPQRKKVVKKILRNSANSVLYGESLFFSTVSFREAR
jgi:hypothetical protein